MNKKRITPMGFKIAAATYLSNIETLLGEWLPDSTIIPDEEGYIKAGQIETIKSLLRAVIRRDAKSIVASKCSQLLNFLKDY
jgi:hypothetical protein